jgi:hypothetical protein
MPRTKKTILYLSDSEESDYESVTQDTDCKPEMEDPPIEKMPLDYPTEPAPPVPGTQTTKEKNPTKTLEKIPGVRKRDADAVLPKKYVCPHCNRPYCQKPAYDKHEPNCIVKLRKQAEEAETLHKIKDESVKKLQMRKYYQEVIKPAREARRPVEYVKKKPGPKPAPIQVEISESESEEEPVVIKKKAVPKKPPAPKHAKKKPAPVYESDEESDEESEYESPPKRKKPPVQQNPAPRYIIKF